MKLIVGLGNPGMEYENTRHNVGFMVIDKFIEHIGYVSMKKKYDGLYCEVFYQNEKIIILKPQKYINLSGEVVKKFIDYYKIDISDILIINDDLDLPVGCYKLKPSGGSAGHNGLKNIEKELNTNEYKRLKIGISNNKNIETKDYVLGKFSNDDKKALNRVIDKSILILDDYLKFPFQDVMSKYNRKISGT